MEVFNILVFLRVFGGEIRSRYAFTFITHVRWGWPCLASGSCIGLLNPDLRLLLGLRAAPLPTSTAFPGGWAPIMVKEGAIGVGELRGPGLTFLVLPAAGVPAEGVLGEAGVTAASGLPPAGGIL